MFGYTLSFSSMTCLGFKVLLITITLIMVIIFRGEAFATSISAIGRIFILLKDLTLRLYKFEGPCLTGFLAFVPMA
jgi:hypothetical protein